MQDLWLLKLDALDRPNDAFISELHRLAPAVQSWQSMEGELTYIYMPGHMPPIAVTPSHGADWHRLVCLQDIDGASARQIAPYHYVVETDVLPEDEEDLNSWYAQEHLPGLAAVSGTVRASRYIDAGSSPRYYACYDLASLDTLGSPAWLAIRGTSWSSRVRPAFRNTRRTMFRRATAPAT